MSASTAYKLMAVVEAYPREQALELGLEKAYGLVRWSKKTGSDRSPSELAASNALIGKRARARADGARAAGPAPAGARVGARNVTIDVLTSEAEAWLR